MANLKTAVNKKKKNYANSKIYYKINNSLYELNNICTHWIFNQTEKDKNIQLSTTDNKIYFLNSNNMNLDTKFSVLNNIIDTTFMKSRDFMDNNNFKSSFSNIGETKHILIDKANNLKNKGEVEKAVDLLEDYADKILMLYQHESLKLEQEIQTTGTENKRASI